MTTATKIWLIIALCLLLAGAAIFTATMMKLNWDFSKLNTQKIETNTYEFSETFTNLAIESSTTDILLAPSQDGKCRVVCHEYAKQSHTVTVEDGTLTVRAEDTRKWYDHITFFSFRTPKLTVYLPQSEYADLQIAVTTGDVELPENFTFSNINIAATTGDVECRASATGDIRIAVTTGDIEMENLSAGTITLSITTGDTDLTDITCQNLTSSGVTGDLEMEDVILTEKLSVERSTGDVELKSCDAGEISIETSTGDVTGTLRSSKIFQTETSTGRINVPQSTSGGICKITTSTGSIKIEIQ